VRTGYEILKDEAGNVVQSEVVREMLLPLMQPLA
jgi:hypothetical protein